jgi:hypothetical protein
VARENLANGRGSPLERSVRRAVHSQPRNRIGARRLWSCNSVVTPLGLASFMPARRRSREIEELVQGFIRRLAEALESATSARALVLSEEYMRAAATSARRPEPNVQAVPERPSPTLAQEPDVAAPSREVQPRPPRAERVRPKRQPPAPAAEAKAAPAIDLEEQRRTAELARLRAILRPIAPVPAAPPVIASVPRAAEEKDGLQALEDLIRDQVAALARLSQSRYTARIAAWVGSVRLHQSGPDGERTRIASRMLFEKLRTLAWSMEAGPIEALNTAWSTRNWERYIHENEVLAATPDAAPTQTPELDAEVDVWATPTETGTQA